MDYTWADDMPKKCPPDGAFPPSDQYFRVVKNAHPVVGDFRRWADEPWNSHKPKKSCSHYGMSVYSTFEGAVRHIEFFANRYMKEPFVGVSTLNLHPAVGLIKQTGQDVLHHDLWVQVGADITLCVKATVPGRAEL